MEEGEKRMSKDEWNMEDEKRFINRLGRPKTKDMQDKYQSSLTRLELLQRYLQALKVRKIFPTPLNKEKLIEYAIQAIDKEINKDADIRVQMPGSLPENLGRDSHAGGAHSMPQLQGPHQEAAKHIIPQVDGIFESSKRA